MRKRHTTKKAGKFRMARAKPRHLGVAKRILSRQGLWKHDSDNDQSCKTDQKC